MISEVFYWILNISILGSAVGLIVLLLRRVRVLPRFAVYLLWALPLIRFWMPIGPASKYSLLSFLSQYTTKTVVVWELAPHSQYFTATNFMQAAIQYSPIVYTTDLLQNIFNIGGMIWAIVAAGAILCSILLYIFTKSALKGADHVKDNIYRSDKVLSPAVYGIFRPKIILPVNIADTDPEYILNHEQVHIRRLDNLWRMIAVITACVHWFNPLVWVFLKAFMSDMELACDAGVLKKLDQDQHNAYASAILSYSFSKSYIASAFGGAKAKARIENILSYKRLTLLSCICIGLLVTAVAITLLTNSAE